MYAHDFNILHCVEQTAAPAEIETGTTIHNGFKFTFFYMLLTASGFCVTDLA